MPFASIPQQCEKSGLEQFRAGGKDDVRWPDLTPTHAQPLLSATTPHQESPTMRQIVMVGLKRVQNRTGTLGVTIAV